MAQHNKVSSLSTTLASALLVVLFAGVMNCARIPCRNPGDATLRELYADYVMSDHHESFSYPYTQHHVDTADVIAFNRTFCGDCQAYKQCTGSRGTEMCTWTNFVDVNSNRFPKQLSGVTCETENACRCPAGWTCAPHYINTRVLLRSDDLSECNARNEHTYHRKLVKLPVSCGCHYIQAVANF